MNMMKYLLYWREVTKWIICFAAGTFLLIEIAELKSMIKGN